MNAQDLRNSILQLAIQGKLVEQREEEGTAKELLEQIKAEKEQLIKEGRIKKQKKIPKINEDEVIFDIPESWEWVRLIDLALFIKAGGDKPKDFFKEKTETHTVPVIANGIQNKGIIGYTKEATVEEPCITVSGRGTIGFSCIRTEPFTPVVRLLVLNISKKIAQNYIQHVLTALLERGIGTSIKQLTVPMLEPKLIPLPPLEEQKRIVAKIEELMPYVEKYDKAYSEVEELNKKFPEDMQKSILQYAIQGKLVEQREEEGTAEELYQRIQEEMKKQIKEGKVKKPKNLPEITEEDKPFDIPKSWKWVSIGQVCSNIMYGTSKKSSKEGKIAVLRMGNLQDGIVDYSNLVYSSDDGDIKKYKLEKNDLLFNRTNSRELVGRTAIYKSELPAIYAGYLVRFTPVLVSSDYINFVMQSDYYWRYCQSVRSDAIGQSNINAEKLKRFVFPLPPLEEQQRIVAKLEELIPYFQQLVK